MAGTLVIRLLDSEANQVSWHPLGAKSPESGPIGSGTLKEAAEQAAGWRVVVLVPSVELLLTTVDIPTKNRQRLRQAVPFTLENDLAEELDELHFAIHTSSPDGKTLVAVIAKQLLDDWLNAFHQVGIAPLAMYPDLLALPRKPNCWTLYLDDERVLVRTGDNTGFAADPVNFAELLRLSIDQTEGDPPERLEVIQAPSLSSAPYFDLALGNLNYEITHVDYSGDFRQLLSDNLIEQQTLNLLQGDYRQVDKQAQKWQHWLPAAILFGVFLGLSIVSSSLDHYRLKGENAALSQRITQTFRDAFPGIKRIVDPRVQMEQKLRKLRKDQKQQGDTFIDLFSVPAAEIMKIPGSRLNNISYREGQLDLQLTTRELPALEKLKKQIEAQNLSVEIRSANAKGNEVSSHLRVRKPRT